MKLPRWARRTIMPLAVALSAVSCGGGGGGTDPDNPTSWSSAPSVVWSSGQATAIASASDQDGTPQVCVGAPFTAPCGSGSYNETIAVPQTRQEQSYSTQFTAREGSNASISKTVPWTVPALPDDNPVFSNVTYESPVMVNGNARVGFRVSDDYGVDKVVASCLSGGCDSQTLDLGNVLNADTALYLSLPEVGSANVQVTAYDDVGQTAQESGLIEVRSPEYKVRFTEMTDHRVPLNSGTLTVDGVEYAVRNGAATFNASSPEVCMLFSDADHTTPRQSVQRVTPGQAYTYPAIGVNWMRESCVPTTLPNEPAELELFAMKDDWQPPVGPGGYGVGWLLYERMQSNDTIPDVNARKPHPHLCDNANVTPGTDNFTFEYWFNDARPGEGFGPVPDSTKVIVRDFLERVVPENLSQNIRLKIIGSESDNEPSIPYIMIMAHDTQTPPGDHNETLAENGCLSTMDYLVPTQYSLEANDVARELVSNLVAPYDNWGGSNSHMFDLEGPDPSILGPFARDVTAVRFAYGARPGGTFW